MTFTKWVRICDEGEQKWQDYLDSLEKMTPQELLKEFFTYLDYVEMRGEGGDQPRHYISISCGRVMMAEPFSEVLQHMRKLAV